jgi:hypothetical protein
MTKRSLLSAIAFVIATGVLILSANDAAAQGWKRATIKYEESKDQGILAAEYRIVPMKKGCRLTIRLTNNLDKKITHYWFKFVFKEGHKHENQMTDHLPGKSEELTYQSCGVPRIQISAVD